MVTVSRRGFFLITSLRIRTSMIPGVLMERNSPLRSRGDRVIKKPVLLRDYEVDIYNRVYFMWCRV